MRTVPYSWELPPGTQLQSSRRPLQLGPPTPETGECTGNPGVVTCNQQDPMQTSNTWHELPSLNVPSPWVGRDSTGGRLEWLRVPDELSKEENLPENG